MSLWYLKHPYTSPENCVWSANQPLLCREFATSAMRQQSARVTHKSLRNSKAYLRKHMAKHLQTLFFSEHDVCFARLQLIWRMCKDFLVASQSSPPPHSSGQFDFKHTHTQTLPSTPTTLPSAHFALPTRVEGVINNMFSRESSAPTYLKANTCSPISFVHNYVHIYIYSKAVVLGQKH